MTIRKGVDAAKAMAAITESATTTTNGNAGVVTGIRAEMAGAIAVRVDSRPGVIRIRDDNSGRATAVRSVGSGKINEIRAVSSGITTIDVRAAPNEAFMAIAPQQRSVYYAPQQQWTQYFPGFGGQQYRNRGQMVREQRHYHNDQRKQYKRAIKEQRRQQRRSRSSYYSYNSGNVYNNYQGYQPRRSGMRQQLIQAVLGNAIAGGQLGGLERMIPQQRYAQSYQPTYNYSPRYNQTQQYYAPQYPQAYSPVYNDGYGYSGTSSSGIGSILQALPVGDIIQQYTGGNDFLSSIVSNAMPTNDMGGEGYGYDDAAYMDEGDEPQQPSGSGDLISMVLQNVLSGV